MRDAEDVRTRPGSGTATGEELLSLGQLADDLLRRVPAPLGHERSFLPHHPRRATQNRIPTGPISGAQRTATQERFADLELGADTTSEQLEALIADDVVPALRAEAAQLAELAVPDGDDDAYAAILDAFTEGIDAVEADPLSLLAGDPLGGALELATSYGFEVCGEGPATALQQTDGGGTVELSAEQQAVATVVEELYDGATGPDRGVELVEGGEAMREALEITSANPLTASLRTVVTDVQFPDDATCTEAGLEPGCALAINDFLLGDAVVSADSETYLLLVDGEWKVSDDSFCDAAARSGTPCPDRP